MKSFISLAGVVKFLVIMVVNFLIDINRGISGRFGCERDIQKYYKEVNI